MADADPSATHSPTKAATTGLHGLDPGELMNRGLEREKSTGRSGGWVAPEPEEVARLLPQFQIERLLGRGGMGAVYKGIQLALGRPVAIKLLPAEIAADAQFVVRFEREARTLARLQHPRIVTIHDFGRTGEGHLYFVMEYVDGTDLRRILKGPGLDPEQALAVVGQLCDALQAAHREGIVHRDIKPENVLITHEGYVKLADFGLARPPREEDTPEITRTNVVMGTPQYMSPEQFSGAGHADHRSDIFALGVMLYEMLTGQPPRGAFDPPSSRRRELQIDVRVDEVVLKALQSEPSRRYQQASEMKTDVDRIQNTPRPVAGVAKAAPPRKKKSGAVVLGTVGVVALLAIADYFFRSRFAPQVGPVERPDDRAEAVVAPPLPSKANEALRGVAATVTSDYDPVYATGFESPDFREGAFSAGQGTGLRTQSSHWSLYANGNGVELDRIVKVEGQIVRGGRQALMVDADGAHSVQAGFSTSIENSAHLLSFSADVFLATSSRQTAWQFAVGDNDVSGGYVGGFNVSAEDGSLQLISQGFPNTKPVVKRDGWTHVEVRLDIDKQTYDVLMDQRPVASGVAFLAKAKRIRVFQFDTFADGDDRACFDNFCFAVGRASGADMDQRNK